MKLSGKTNFRIVVEPMTRYIKEDAVESRCHHIREEIIRHCDDVKQAYVEWDNYQKCSHCDYDWEIDTETGEPQCCTKAQNEWLEEKSKVPSENGA